MKNSSFKRIVLSCICILFCTIESYSQENNITPYEKARISLADDTIKQMLEAMNAGDKFYFTYALTTLEEQNQDTFAQLDVKETLIYTYCGVGNLFKTEANIMAESLFSDKRYQGHLLKSLQSIGQNYIQKRKEIECKKTDSDTAREEERAFYRTGAGRVIYDISAEIKKWATKGQYETTKEYEDRLKEQLTHKLDSICFSQCDKASWRGVTIERLSYDADSGKQNIAIYQTDNNSNHIAELHGQIPMTIEESKGFSFNKFGLYYSTGLCMVDNCLMPSSMKLEYYIKDDHFNWDPVERYSVNFHEEEKYVIKGTSLLGLPKNIRELLTDYIFDYSEFTSQIISWKELRSSAHCILDKYEEVFPKVVFEVRAKREDQNCYIFEYNNQFYAKSDINIVSKLYQDKCIMVLEKMLMDKVSLSYFKDLCTPGSDLTKEQAESLITQSCADYVRNASPEDVARLFSFMIKSRNVSYSLNFNEISKAYIENHPELLEGFTKFYKKVSKIKRAGHYQEAYDICLKEPYYIYYIICTFADDSLRLDCLRADIYSIYSLLYGGQWNLRQGILRQVYSKEYFEEKRLSWDK